MNTVQAQSEKDTWKLKHIVKTMKMNHNLSVHFTPVFYAYMKELHAAKDIYDNVKKRYKNNIDHHKLTPQQGKELLEAHWKSDEAVVQVRKKYTQQFSTMLSPEHVYRVFTLANDKMKQ